jgi:hypothetical protein
MVRLDIVRARIAPARQRLLANPLCKHGLARQCVRLHAFACHRGLGFHVRS